MATSAIRHALSSCRSQQPMTDITLFIQHAEGRSVAGDRAAVAQVESSVP
jgi:hypothetical protein